MTEGVVTADVADTLQHVGELMRDRNVGSVVICDGGRPTGVITDRDLALAVVADRIGPASPAGDHASRPLVRKARMNPSTSPFKTRSASPTSKPVRWSLTSR